MIMLLLGGAVSVLTDALVTNVVNIDYSRIRLKTQWMEVRDIHSSAMTWRNLALQLNPGNVNVYYVAASLSFDDGSWEDALALAEKGLKLQPHNVRLLALQGDIYTELNQPQLALEAYVSAGALARPASLTVNYLRRGDQLRLNGDESQATEAFEQALALDAGNLYAQYRLEALGKANGFIRATFSLNRWLDAHLLAYDAQAALGLYERGEMDAEAALNILDFTLWRGEAPAVLPVVQTFCAGGVLETQCGLLLKEACQRAHSDCAGSELTSEFARSDQAGQTTVNNLLANPDFERKTEQGQPEVWQWSPMFSRSPWGLGYFVGGLDCVSRYEGLCALRVQGFWQEANVPAAPRAGYVSNLIALEARTCYQLSFFYRTSPYLRTTRAGVNIPTLREVLLPDTKGRWEPYHIKFNLEDDQQGRLYFRMWGEGAVWYDQLRLSPDC